MPVLSLQMGRDLQSSWQQPLVTAFAVRNNDGSKPAPNPKAPQLKTVFAGLASLFFSQYGQLSISVGSTSADPTNSGSKLFEEKKKKKEKGSQRASLVAQWLRICLPMQGTRVRALVWEDPTCRGAAGPMSHNY
ncbi:hypothetical protein J1605_006805 [Eschrichtius robustus]|uniref:Uncharacterized protein n=1 Tax=Eschrichtius robustus TaxID=9764 RepID=A0AB34H4N2_ESCRO|nr:hypothetical protein J1605_006805 [Eschrichtius robustus]